LVGIIGIWPQVIDRAGILLSLCWSLLLVRVLPAFLQPVYIALALSVAVSKGDKSNENELMGIVFSGVAIAMATTVPFATYKASILTWEIPLLSSPSSVSWPFW